MQVRCQPRARLGKTIKTRTAGTEKKQQGKQTAAWKKEDQINNSSNSEAVVGQLDDSQDSLQEKHEFDIMMHEMNVHESEEQWRQS